VPRHVTWLFTRLVVDYFTSCRLVVNYFASRRLVVNYFALRRLVVNYFAYVARPGASACSTARRRLLFLRRAPRRAVSLLNFSSVGCTGSRRAPGHSFSRLVYSVRGRCDFVLRPHWLYFSDAVRRDYLSHGNTSSTSSTPHTAATSYSSCIALTTHLD
jgi:hypothetical protein